MARLTKAARRRGATPAATSASGDEIAAIRRAWCAKIFDDPGRVTDALSHPITGRFEIAPHHHADLVQLDVMRGCAGEATLDGSVIPIRGTTLMASLPGQQHGYTLRPVDEHAAVWLVKLRVGKHLNRRGDGPLPPLLTGLSDLPVLLGAMAEFVRDWTPQGVNVVALAKLATAICAWPASANDAAESTQGSNDMAQQGDGASMRVRRAVEALGARFADPPSLEELAAAASMSSRHFARRFRQDFGCTPHEFLSTRRLDAARGLLRDDDCLVTDVADRLGFSSPAAFSRWFTRLAGQSPRAFRADPHNF